MSLAVLEGLVQLKHWQAGADVAEQLLAGANLSREDRAGVLRALCECRNRLGDPAAAIRPGHDAVLLARESGQWDLLGRALIDLAAAYYFCSHYKEAAATYREYLALCERFEAARSLAPRVQYNLAVALEAHGRLTEAITVLETLLQGDLPGVEAWELNRYRQKLAFLLLEARRLAGVPALLIACEEYVQAHPDDGAAQCHLWNDRA